MAKTHTVELGDWIGAIAEAYGFDHWSKLWDHKVNEPIRALRKSPDLLLVGDDIQIPETSDERGIEVPTGHRAVFVVRGGDVLRLEVIGIGSFIAAFGPVDFALEIGEQKVEGKIEQEGQELTVVLAPTAKQAKLTLMGSDVYEFFIGGIGPVDEERGAHARLVNLGYGGAFEPGGAAGPDGGEAVVDPLVEALLLFQARNGLPPTGELDAKTKGALHAQYEG
jgi:hypothetical protein